MTSNYQRFAWYSWNQARSSLLSIRLDSCFGLVGPLQPPAIDSNVDPARNYLYQASAPAAGIRDSNVVMPHGRQKKAIYRGRIYFYGLGKELTLIAAPRWTAP